MKPGRKNKKAPGFAKEFNRLLEVCNLLNKEHAQYIVVGGVAANLHGLIRATKDIDLLIPKDFHNTKKVLKALENLTWGIAKEIAPEEILAKPFTIIGDLPRVDLLTVAKNINFEEALLKCKSVRFRNTMILYLSIDDLIRSKKTGRLQDLSDIEQLEYLKRNKRNKPKRIQNKRRSRNLSNARKKR